MIDDMWGLFKTAKEAFEAGERSGRGDLFLFARDGICGISVSYEVKPPNDAMATQGFRVAQQCAQALVDAKVALDKRDDARREGAVVGMQDLTRGTVN